MICLHCGYCCKKYCVVVVKDPEKDLSEDNLFFYDGQSSCPHLKGDKPGNYSCAVHDKPWYSQTPCFEHSQFELKNTNCRLGEYILNHLEQMQELAMKG